MLPKNNIIIKSLYCNFGFHEEKYIRKCRNKILKQLQEGESCTLRARIYVYMRTYMHAYVHECACARVYVHSHLCIKLSK